jgi:hypothetical protein
LSSDPHPLLYHISIGIRSLAIGILIILALISFQ